MGGVGVWGGGGNGGRCLIKLKLLPQHTSPLTRFSPLAPPPPPPHLRNTHTNIIHMLKTATVETSKHTNIIHTLETPKTHTLTSFRLLKYREKKTSFTRLKHRNLDLQLTRFSGSPLTAGPSVITHLRCLPPHTDTRCLLTFKGRPTSVSV